MLGITGLFSIGRLGGFFALQEGVSNFTPIASTIGGVLIGLSGLMLLGLAGRIAGISGIVGGLVDGQAEGRSWRFAFTFGLLAGGVVALAMAPTAFGVPLGLPTWALIAAGLLVGYGTRLGSGCTSGHGVCGLSRLSARSMVATVVFMGSGMLTVFVTRHIGGGLL